MGSAEPERVLAARYRLQGVIRGDDMGAVWLARDLLVHRDVVLRAIPWPAVADAGEREPRLARAQREADALAQLDHPNIAGVCGLAGDAGQPWMVYEAAPYRFPYSSLSDVVRNEGPLRPEQAAGVGRQVLAAISQAHAVGVLHRDVKPASILLGAGGRVLLADFGMVTADGSPALTTPAELTGSPRYMAPERARGEPATPAADLWSLGAVLYAAVEGRAPFDRDDTVAVLTAVMDGHPDPPRRAGPLWPVISGLLRKDPGARPDAAGVDWLLHRVAAGPSPARLAASPGTAPEPATAAATSGRDTGSYQAGPAAATVSMPRPQEGAGEDAGAGSQPGAADGDTGSPAGLVPGFGPRDPGAAGGLALAGSRPRRQLSRL